MSSASVTHNFVNGTTANADQVDQNFTDLVNFLNSHVAHIPESLQLKTGSTSPKFQVGSDSVSVTTSGNTWSKVVTFPTAFSTAPRVFVVNGIGSGGAKKYAMSVDDPATTTQVTVWALSTDLNPPSGSISVPFYWLAIGT